MRVSGLTWLIVALASLALVNTVGQIVGFYTDWLWFGEVQFTSVFVTVLQTQVLLEVVTSAAFFLILLTSAHFVIALAGVDRRSWFQFSPRTRRWN